MSPSCGPGKLESGLVLGNIQSIAEVPWSKVMKPKGSMGLPRSAEVLLHLYLSECVFVCLLYVLVHI